MPRPNNLRVALFVCLGLIGAGVYSSAAAEKYQPDTNAPNAKARRDAARKVYETAWQHHVQSPDAGPGNVEFYHDWSVRWLHAEQDLSRTKTEQVTALEGHLNRMKLWKERLDGAVKAGAAATHEAAAAEFFHLEAEDWLFAVNFAGK
jgi:hypothetical protein